MSTNADDNGLEHHVPDGSAGIEQRFIKAELGEMTEVESMCPKCEGNGTTRLMITKIPHFREIIVSSFECPHCGESNREVQFGGEYGPKKVKYHLEVRGARDLNRQVVKSDYATVSIPELELELGPEAQKGTLNTVEGILQQVEDGLQFQQAARRVQDAGLYEKIETFCEKLRQYRSGALPFNLWLEDPAGNSYVEAIYHEGGGHVDPQLTRFEITRSEEERRQIGLAGDGAYNTTRSVDEEHAVDRGAEDEVSEFLQPCPACFTTGTVKVHSTTIPHFGRIVIMAFKCDSCGYKSNDIKHAAEISPRGRRITLLVEDETDMVRDVLKSDSTKLTIPEIDLEMSPGTLGGFFSTVEGLLSQVYDNLANLRQTEFEGGDSSLPKGVSSMKEFLEALAALRDGQRFPFSLCLEDPLGLIYVQRLSDDDPRVTQEEYDRTHEENVELGLAN